MSMRFTPSRLVTGVLAVVALSTVAPAPASAATPRNGVCEAGEFCLYRDANYTGVVMDWARGADDDRYADNAYPSGHYLDDTTSSVWNRSNCAVSIWQHRFFGDPGIKLAAGARTNTAGTPLGDNLASSHNACT
jgi:hypothetical protein